MLSVRCCAYDCMRARGRGGSEEVHAAHACAGVRRPRRGGGWEFVGIRGVGC